MNSSTYEFCAWLLSVKAKKKVSVNCFMVLAYTCFVVNKDREIGENPD